MSDRLNIIDTLDKDGKFATFARLLRSSKAADLITGAGPFTVFAPTNDAFGKVPDAQMNGWLSQTGQTDLAKVLSYHVVASHLFAANLDGKGPTATLSGAEVTFSDSNGLKVNQSGVQARNIEATNGVIHALDTVLTPPGEAVAASAAPVGARSTTAPVAEATTLTTMQADGHSDAAAVNMEAAANVVPIASAPAASAVTPNSGSSLV